MNELINDFSEEKPYPSMNTWCLVLSICHSSHGAHTHAEPGCSWVVEGTVGWGGLLHYVPPARLLVHTLPPDPHTF